MNESGMGKANKGFLTFLRQHPSLKIVLAGGVFDIIHPGHIHTLNEAKKLGDFLSNEYEPIMVQEYLPIVKKGDKRIILINGEPVGCLNRVPAEGEFRSNLGVGGLPELSELSSRDIEICERIRKTLIDYDLYFVGIDAVSYTHLTLPTNREV